MPLTYLDAIDHLYGTSEFTVRDFATRVGNRRATKLLSDLKLRGYVARVGRGRYRRLEASERPDLRSSEWQRVREILLKGPDPKAWAGESAVEVWTGGRYRTSPSVFTRVYTLAVPKSSLGKWHRYLHSKGISSNPKKRIGARVELLPVADLKVTFTDGEPVLPKGGVIRLIRAHPGIFAGAEALMRDRS
ncbi:MAG: hypothetical protein L3K14_04760 [Thermoplasmata archaeon]|nr:hypothetical protein [Thermoplasmata archaeon]